MQSTIKILNVVALAASFLNVVTLTPVAQVPGANPNKNPGAINRVRPRPPLRPDLVVVITSPRMANAGDEIGRDVKIRAKNLGLAAALGSPGPLDPTTDGYMIDVVLSTDPLLPDGFANLSENFAEDVLLRGGRISRTADLASGAARAYRVGATIPADTPSGRYLLCARIDPGNKVAESNEHNNTACYPIFIRGGN